MSSADITGLLIRMRDGEQGALDAVFRQVYGELRGIARRQLARGRPWEIGTTGVVHECYLKLIDRSRASWHDRNHFFSVAAKAMRQIIIDAARRQAARKRGGDERHEPFDDKRDGIASRAEEMLALDQGLSRLKQLDPRLAHVVELRFFAGLDEKEVAELLRVTPRTVRRDWRKARAFLFRELGGGS